jgi:holin-like protein
MMALQGLALLLLFQAAGDVVIHALGWPFPGPVVGMVLVLGALQVGALRAPIAATAELLLSHLSLLFVPVGVGVITHLPLVSHYAARLLVVIVASTWIGLAVTALLLRRLMGDEADPSSASAPPPP